MLERVAIHQTRLRVPGLGFDARGVVLGRLGLVLLPSLERVVTFLAAWSRGRSLATVVTELGFEVLQSELGSTEIAVVFAAEGTDRMDAARDAARLLGAPCFTGTDRHFVQYREDAAPHGFDAVELLGGSGDRLLHHSTFHQAYRRVRTLAPASLVERVPLALAPATPLEPPYLVLAEPALGPLLMRLLLREGARFAAARVVRPSPTPAAAAWLLQVQAAPRRLEALVTGTPGLTAFLPAAPGVAVERGHASRVDLVALPVFPGDALCLLRGRGRPALRFPTAPSFAPGDSILGVTLGEVAAIEVAEREVRGLEVPVRLAPSDAGMVPTAARVTPEELPALRLLAYRMPASWLQEVSVAVGPDATYLVAGRGALAPPVGVPHYGHHPDVFLPLGWRPTPRVPPAELARALGARGEHVVFVRVEGPAERIARSAFVPLARALLSAEAWAPVEVLRFEALASAPLRTLEHGDTGLLERLGRSA